MDVPNLHVVFLSAARPEPKEAQGSRPSRAKRQRYSYIRSYADSDDSDDGDDHSRSESNTQVVKILTKLLDATKEENGDQAKKLSEMTEEELDREQKEQNVRLTRLKCEQVRESTKMATALVSALTRIAKSAETLVETFKQKEMEPICVYPDTHLSQDLADDRSTFAHSEIVPENSGPSTKQLHS